jgi:hypothetical protein
MHLFVDFGGIPRLMFCSNKKRYCEYAKIKNIISEYLLKFHLHNLSESFEKAKNQKKKTNK